MDGLSIVDPEFVGLDRAHQNEVLDALLKDQQLIPTLLAALDALPWNPENSDFQNLWLGLASIHLFESRIEAVLVKPIVRGYLKLLVAYQQQMIEPDEEIESFIEIWEGVGISAEDAAQPTKSWGSMYEQAILQAGTGDWERSFGFIQAVRQLAPMAEGPLLEKLVSLPLLVILGSRPNRRAADMWRDIYGRSTFDTPDLLYHDSRLRRSLLDENMDHAYHLMSVLMKNGDKSSDLLAGVIRAAYDIDYEDDARTLGLFIGASGLLEAAPLISQENFRVGIAKLIWDLSIEPKRQNERVFYDEISLIKSREILLDFRKAMLRSDFIQAWGYAEYAFVHGFEPLDLLDELIRLSPSFYNGGKQLLWAWKHLMAVESLLRLLPDEIGIYVMAHTVRLMSRAPKNPDLLDPFPDEDQ